MNQRYEDLNELHMDVLREIGNIGAGNAATSLSVMLGQTIDITLPKVKVVCGYNRNFSRPAKTFIDGLATFCKTK